MNKIFFLALAVHLAWAEPKGRGGRPQVVNHDAQTFSTSGDTTKSKPEIDEIRRQARSIKDSKECYTTDTGSHATTTMIFTRAETSTLIFETDNFGKTINVINISDLPTSPQPPQPERTALASDYEYDYPDYRDNQDNQDFPAEICSWNENDEYRFYCGTKACSTIFQTSKTATRTTYTHAIIRATLRPCGACSIRVKIIPRATTLFWEWKQEHRCVWSHHACAFKRQRGPNRRQGGSRRRTG